MRDKQKPQCLQLLVALTLISSSDYIDVVHYRCYVLLKNIDEVHYLTCTDASFYSWDVDIVHNLTFKCCILKDCIDEVQLILALQLLILKSLLT